MAVGDVNATTKGSGARFNDGKPDISLIPLPILVTALARRPDTVGIDPKNRVIECLSYLADWQQTGDDSYLYDALNSLDAPFTTAARVFMYGAKKYAAWNWAKGMAWSIPIGCIGRHAGAILDGELNDPESSQPHEGHIACNIIMLIHFTDFFPEGDDITFKKILPTE